MLAGFRPLLWKWFHRPDVAGHFPFLIQQRFGPGVNPPNLSCRLKDPELAGEFLAILCCPQPFLHDCFSVLRMDSLCPAAAQALLVSESEDFLALCIHITIAASRIRLKDSDGRRGAQRAKAFFAGPEFGSSLLNPAFHAFLGSFQLSLAFCTIPHFLTALNRQSYERVLRRQRQDAVLWNVGQANRRYVAPSFILR